MLTNFFDVIFLLIFAFCTLWGFFIGFLGSLVLFGFIFLGAIFAKAVHLNLQSLILNLVGNPNLSASEPRKPIKNPQRVQNAKMSRKITSKKFVSIFFTNETIELGIIGKLGKVKKFL